MSVIVFRVARATLTVLISRKPKESRSMNRRHRSSAITSLVVTGAVIALAVAGSGASASSGTRAASGGTLKMLGSADVGNLDPVSNYNLPGTALTRMFTRQLVSYADNADFAKAAQPAADVATTLPTVANGGISKDRRTYTLRLRPGVMWDTTPARAVTAADFVRGFAMLCNPASPSGAQGYYTSTIVGMASYCGAFAKVPPKVPAIAAFVKGHTLSGVTATSPTTIVFKLTQPATDFLNILALGFSSARPVEYMQYLPDSAQWRQHSISDGPYRVAKYTPTKGITFDRNPAWKASSDPIRKAYVDHIEVVEGLSVDSVQQQLEAGTGDMEWDDTVPTQQVPGLLHKKDPRLMVAPNGNYASLINYIALNLYAGPMKNKLVRQALATAIDKNVLVQLLGGPQVNAPANQMIPPGSAGFVPDYNAFPANTGSGNADAAKKLLAKAGFANGGPTIKLLYPNVDPLPRVSQAMQSNLEKAGFKVTLVVSTPTDYFPKYLQSPAIARKDTWDITPVAWGPDWFGNNGRSIIQPLFTSAGANSPNYGGYHNPTVEKLIAQALAAPTTSAAAQLWAKADRTLAADVAVVPTNSAKYTTFHASRVHGCHAFVMSLNCDPTNVSLG
jgi:ABC-type transport system substrate-binding protein